MGRKTILWLALGSLAMLLAAGGAAQAATVYTYTGPDGGNWSVADNWNYFQVPDGADAQAWINNNAAADVTVNLDMTATLSGLTVDAGDHLQITNTSTASPQYLYLAKDGATQPVVTNNGTITLNPSSNCIVSVNPQDAQVTLSGSGSLVLGGGGGLMAYLGYWGSIGKFINSASHTIIGHGAIIAPVDNYGTITAQGELAIVGAVTNKDGGGLLTISGSASKLAIGNTTVTDGQINPQDGTLMLVNATLMRTDLGPGSVSLEGVIGGNTSYFRGSLTTEADLTLGDGAGLIIQKDGYSQPTIINQGAITLSPSSGNSAYLVADFDTQATLGGGGSIVLGGEGDAYLGANGTNSKFINYGNTIRGEGYIQAPVLNYGTIRAEGGALVLSGAVMNPGVLTTAGIGSTLELQGLVGGGTITPNGGAVYVNGGSLNLITVQEGNVSFNNATLTDTSLGAGSGTMNGVNHVQGELTTEANLTLESGAQLYIEKDATHSYAVITNDGAITLSPASGQTANIRASDTQVFLTGSGSLVLGGEGDASLSYSGGGKFINYVNHTIKGEGRILAPVDNYGTITAQGGTLLILSPVTNMLGGGILNVSGASDQLYIHTTVTGGQINPQSGTLLLGEATLVRTNLGPGRGTLTMNNYFRGSLTSQADLTLGGDAALYIQKDGDNQPTITNQGTISLSPGSGGWAYLVASGAQATFSGGGSLVLGGDGIAHLTAYGEDKFINDTAHTIRGEGDLSAPLTNNGRLIAENGVLQVNRAITGNGKVSVSAGATLELNGVDVHTGNFEMLGSAALTGGSSRTFDLTGNFTFTQTDASKWNSGDGFGLQMSGAGGIDGQQSLEVGGKDYGAVITGFTGNFHLEELSLTESATYAYLLDACNNGNRGDAGEAEALYVDTLSLADGTTLNLNGLHLYTYLEGYVEVFAGDTRFGGTIINSPVPLPGTLLLLGSGLLGLAGVRRRFMRN